MLLVVLVLNLQIKKPILPTETCFGQVNTLDRQRINVLLVSGLDTVGINLHRFVCL